MNAHHESSTPSSLELELGQDMIPIVIYNYSECWRESYSQLLDRITLVVREKEKQSIVPDEEYLDELLIAVRSEFASVTTLCAMIDYAGLLIEHGLRHEAFFVYFVAIKRHYREPLIRAKSDFLHCIHDALLQIAKLLKVGNMKYEHAAEGRECAENILNCLVSVFNSEEAASFLG